MHVDEFHIDQPLVQKLIQQQFPEWAGLELKPVLSAGTDHALYKLGNEMVIRLPKIDGPCKMWIKSTYGCPK